MEKQDYIELTSTEISTLWAAYQSDTMAICGLNYFLKHVEDQQIEAILQETLASVELHVQKLTNLFQKEQYPVPQGFTEQDVNVHAPRLFTDKLYLEYILNMTDLSLTTYAGSLVASERKDVIQYFSDCLVTSKDLHKKAKQLSKEKGIYIRSPYIPKPNQIDFVKKQSFLAGWFADRRPLVAAEITNLVFNARRNTVGQALITGFSQVAQSKEVARYFERGRDIAGKHLEIFTSILNEEYLSSGSSLMTSEVTDSTIPPFSDKLMMFLVSTLIASGMGQYGISMSMSPRRDLGVMYTRLAAEIANYADDGANIMINHGWMEQPPMAADRKELAN